MIKEAEELCKASATSLFSAFTAVYVVWGFFKPRLQFYFGFTCGWPSTHLTLNSWVHVGGF